MFGNQALTIGNLVSHSHERLKTKDETKEMKEEERKDTEITMNEKEKKFKRNCTPQHSIQ